MKALSMRTFRTITTCSSGRFANDKKSENPTEHLQPPTAFLLEFDNTHVRPLSTTYDDPAHVPPLNNFSVGPGPRFHLG